MRRITLSFVALILGLIFAAPSGVAVAAPPVIDRLVDVRTGINLCNGETVLLTGTGHYVIQPNPDGTSTWRVTVHSEGVSGDQGNEYVLNVNRQSTFDPSGGFELKVDTQEVLISKGSAPNTIIRFQYDSATGEVNFEVICTG